VKTSSIAYRAYPPTAGPTRTVAATGARTARDVVLAPLAIALAAIRWVWQHPAYLAAATILLVCVPLGDRDVTAEFHITPGDLAAMALVAVAAARALAGHRLPRSLLWWALGAPLVCFAVATLTSNDPAASAFGFIRYAELFVIVPLAVVIVLRERRDALIVCGALVAAALIEGFVGVGQYLTGAGASYQGRDVRAVGTFSALDVQAMAGVVGYGIVVAVGLAMTTRGKTRFWLATAAAFLTVPLLLSLSRGALIATVVALVVMLIVARPRLLLPVGVYGGAVLLLIIGVLGPRATSVGARLDSIGSSVSAPDPSVTDRFTLWRTATQIWQDHPITGVGLKQFPAFRDSYAPLNLSAGSDVASSTLSFQKEPLLSPHNMYLLVLSEQGLLGALGLVVLLLGLIVVLSGRVRAREATPPKHRRGFGAASVGIAALGVVVWTATNFMYGDIGGQTGVMMSVLLGVALWWAVRARSDRTGAIDGADRARIGGRHE